MFAKVKAALAALPRYWKTAIAGVTSALALLTALPPLLGDSTPTWVPVGIGIVGTFLVWLKKNRPAGA